ncbi:MAG: hypothetical protein MZV70_29210 [Desulfobacterales bacterium]|nr:hypothetical protein [Desulfobacterales bacterium]
MNELDRILDLDEEDFESQADYCEQQEEKAPSAVGCPEYTASHSWVGSIREGMICAMCGIRASTHEERRQKSHDYPCIPQDPHIAFLWRQSPEGQAFEAKKFSFVDPKYVGPKDYGEAARFTPIRETEPERRKDKKRAKN